MYIIKLFYQGDSIWLNFIINKVIGLLTAVVVAVRKYEQTIERRKEILYL